MPSLDVISINLWQILISLCNLLILFLILKKFLYKPVRRVMQERQSALQRQYSDANEARRMAEANQKAWEEKMYKALSSVSSAHVVSAIELSNEEKTALIEKLEKLTGNTVAAEYEINESIIGGVIVNIDDKVIDLICPYSKGGKIGLFGGAGVG